MISRFIIYSAHLPKMFPVPMLLFVACLLHPGSLHAQQLFELLPGSKTGVTFKNQLTENEKTNILTYEYFYNGGGVAVGDLNNDGLDDIFFTANMGKNKLYLNQGDMKFKDVSKAAGIEGKANAWTTGVTMVDINQDGLLDIYVCYSGWGTEKSRRNELYINQGNLQFKEQAAAYGLEDPSYSTQAVFFDFDKDGDLDMFLLNHNITVINEIDYDSLRNTRHPMAGDKLYENVNGHLTDISEQAGIKGSPLGFGLGIAVADVNGDGLPDMYVSNDYIEQDYLYINNGEGPDGKVTFTERAADFLQHISHFSMGSDIADVNNDGRPDIFTLDMLPEDNERQKLLYGPENYEQYALMVRKGFHYQNMRNMLQLNNGAVNTPEGTQEMTFSEIGQLAGISNTDWSWSALLADFDNDGWKDLFITNGYYRDYTNRDFLKYKGDYYFQKAINQEKADTFELVNSMTSTPVHNYLFRNNQDLTFSDMSESWGFQTPVFSNGAAYADLDNDGDLDLVVNNLNERAFVYKNLSREQHPKKHYLALQLEGTQAASFGSKITVYAGGHTQWLEYMPTRGFQSSVSQKLHIGLGSQTKADSICITWPSGQQQWLRDVQADQLLKVSREAPQPPVQQQEQVALFSRVASPLQYQHQEYGFNDFKRQPLLLTMLTTCGPVMASADVNGDGLTDIFMGGAKGSMGKIFLQTSEGQFEETTQNFASMDMLSTDADALFFDADGDGDMDLYIASGGYQDYQPTDLLLQDRLYLNDGSGHFEQASEALPPMLFSKSCVKAYDYDQDGDLDLFVGGRVIPGQYPAAPKSFILENDGSGHFTDVTAKKLPQLQQAGMVTDAVWIDLDKDGRKDLVVAGEYMPLRVFLNRGAEPFEEATEQYFAQPLHGLWTKLLAADFDNDGDEDLIAGNFGLNSQLQASQDEPIRLMYQDFDENGSIDPIMSYYIQGEPYPFASRDELLDQLYSMRKKFTSYASFSKAQIPDIFTSEEIDSATILKAETLETLYLENKDNKLVPHTLPKEAQFAPVYALRVLDYNQDGHLDVLLAGNQSAIRIRMGVMDANFGQLFEGDGKGNFRYVPQAQSGLDFKGDIKSMQTVELPDGTYLLVGINNAGVEAYQLHRP